jgi:hypothetical protein
MAQIRFTEVSLDNGRMIIDFQYNDANNRVNRVFVANNSPDMSMTITAESIDGPDSLTFIVPPQTSEERGVPTSWGFTVAFDPEEGTPTAANSNYRISYSAGVMA